MRGWYQVTVSIDFIPNSSWVVRLPEDLDCTALDASAPALQARSNAPRGLELMAAHGPQFPSILRSKACISGVLRGTASMPHQPWQDSDF